MSKENPFKCDYCGKFAIKRMKDKRYRKAVYIEKEKLTFCNNDCALDYYIKKNREIERI